MSRRTGEYFTVTHPSVQVVFSSARDKCTFSPLVFVGLVQQANLQSLRDMGITDEEVARRVLEATNGNIAAAVDLIFGDGQ